MTFGWPKKLLFYVFCDFGWPRRRFLSIFGPKTGARRLLFRCFLENGDFVKIVLLLVVGTRFCRVGPFKNRSRERVRTTTAREHDKKCLWRRFRTHFFVPRHIFGHFWGALGSQNGRLWADFRGFLGHWWLTCGFSLRKGAREGSWDRFLVSRASSRMVLGRILLEFVARVLSKVWSKFCPYFRSVGVPSSVLPLTRPAHKLKGRRSRGAL